MIKSRKLLPLLICLILSASLSPAAFADEEKETVTIHISTEDDLTELAYKCSLDTYSENLTVILDNDIDLKGVKFSPIPTFSGKFEGNGHKIKGFVLATDGSHQGFFRYVREGALINNLTIEGTVTPGNSRCQVGGIAGVNAGEINNCKFNGVVEGLNYIGGIAGINNGTIANCSCSGTVNGKRFTGGIAGYSDGVILNCRNSADVNTEITEGGLELDNLNISTAYDVLSLVSAEDTDVVSDTGGIAGYSSGTIKSCNNLGKVGYQHYGYNVGGIVGRQSGYVSMCNNAGDVLGKKDVAGIAGQMEPYLILKDQKVLKSAISALVSSIQAAINDADSQSGSVTSALNSLQSNAESASDRVYLEEIEITDPLTGETTTIDRVQFEESEDGTTISDDLSAMSDSMAILNSALDSLAKALAADLRVVNANASVVMNLFANALSGNMSVVDYEDVSANSTTMKSEDTDGKVENCKNTGNIEGDTNVGGIAGSMQVEYEFDMDNAIIGIFDQTANAVEGVTSLSYKAKCVNVYNKNEGDINSKKDSTGGIVGYHDIGTVVYDENYGDVISEGAYVGGIAGKSTTLIDKCYAMCSLDGDEYVGGIVGLGKKITDCATIVRMDDVTACFGAIAGYADISDKGNISGNTFVTNTLGAIDGISYSGVAEPQDYSQFITNENIPDEFKELKLTFIADGKKIKDIQFTYGGSIGAASVPEVPEKAGYTGKWPDDLNLVNLSFSDTVEAVYTPRQGAVASEETREEDKLPIIVLDGDFTQETDVKIDVYEGELPETDGELLEAWTVRLENTDDSLEGYSIRYYAPEIEVSNHSEVLYVLEDGAWNKVQTETHGSYLAFDADGDEVTFSCYDVKNKGKTAIYILIAAAGAAIVATVIIMNVKTRKNGKQKDKISEDPGSDI